MEKLYSIRDLCEIMGVCRHTFYHWQRRGIVQSIKVGGTVRIRESEIKRILAVKTRERIMDDEREVIVNARG